MGKPTKKSSSAWQKRSVKDGSKIVGRLTHRVMTQLAFDGERPTLIRKGQFTSMVHGGANPTSAVVTMTLRKRKANAKRESLAKIGVINPKHNPAKRVKAHLAPDTFGGPSSADNLSHETSLFNLSAHKVIENSIGKQMKANFPTAGPLTRQGSMTVEEHFDASGTPTGRTYFAHIDAGNGNPESFHKFTFKKI